MTREAAHLRIALEGAGSVERGIRGAVALPTAVHRSAAAGPSRSRGEEERVLTGRSDRDRAFVRLRQAGLHRTATCPVS